MNAWKLDKMRGGALPAFQYWYRAAASASSVWKIFCKIMLRITRSRNCCEISSDNKIGPGLYIAHPYCITINPAATIGANCNIHKGVTIGQENRGKRKGAPTIGNKVWIGVNSTIVGKINIGDDVMIAPNTFVNCDVPSHSVVFGNPCTVKAKDNATEGYINHVVDI